MASINPKIHVKGVKSKQSDRNDDDEEDSDDSMSGDESQTSHATSKHGKAHGDDEETDFVDYKKMKRERKEKKTAIRAVKQSKEEEKNSRTIFVGNLPSTCERSKLRKHFIECGPIESVRLRGLIPSDSKLTKKAAAIKKSVHETCRSIFGYVVFYDPDSVEKALELKTSKIGDNYISVQRVGIKTFNNDVTVFIGNLPLAVQENAVREFFGGCGQIDGVRVIRDSKTGLGKGFGFVSFSSRDGVILALEKNGAEFEGREMRVTKAGIKEGLTKKTQPGKMDGKNARRRVRHQQMQNSGKKSKSSTERNDDYDSGGEEEEEEGNSEQHDDEQLGQQQMDYDKSAVKKNNSERKKEKGSSISFSGEKMSKKKQQLNKKKKMKKKLVKGRHAVGKKKKIARLLTA